MYRVCVADDNKESASIICKGLQLHGYEAVAVHDGAQAIATCRNGDYDLALLDIEMPVHNGFEVCKMLKDDPKTKDIGIVFITVNGARQDIAQGFELGALDYITKPYNLPMVIVRVDAAMNRLEAQHAIRTGAGPGLTDTAYTDQLTGLRNRRFLLERLQEEVEKAHRYDTPLSCVMFDLDEWRGLDNELGPAPMDDLIVELAMAIREQTRGFDIVARYDASMFVAVLPHTGIDEATKYANNILDEVETTTFSDPSFPTEATMSAGISSCRNGVAYGAEFVLGESMRGLLQAMARRDLRVIAKDLDADITPQAEGPQ